MIAKQRSLYLGPGLGASHILCQSRWNNFGVKIEPVPKKDKANKYGEGKYLLFSLGSYLKSNLRSLFTTERDLHIFVITRLKYCNAVYVTFTVMFQMIQHAAAYLLA